MGGRWDYCLYITEQGSWNVMRTLQELRPHGRGAVLEKWVFYMLGLISEKGALEILVKEQAFALGLMSVHSKQGLCSD